MRRPTPTHFHRKENSMKHSRTPIAAALCALALAAPLAYAAGDTTDRTGSTMNRDRSMSGYGSSVHGSTAMNSEQVRQVQQALSNKGHDVGPIDGIMGPRTRAALRDYQRQNNLSGASGMDQQTLDSLGVHASAGTSTSGSMSSSAGGVPTASGSNASTGTASDGAVQSRGFKNPSRSSAPGSTAGVTPSGSNASDGTASDGGAASKNPSNRPLTQSKESDRALNPSPSGSNASDGTASDGGMASKNPSGTAPGNMRSGRDSGSSAGGSGAATGGTGGR
jgi:peptidoglycan hydrolase-like protein with peptidoglycan-binding domain